MLHIYAGNRIRYTYLGRLRLNPDVDSGFLWLQSMRNEKLIVVTGPELHLRWLIARDVPCKGIVIEIDDFGAKSLRNLLQ